jgi:hypothetical protein
MKIRLLIFILVFISCRVLAHDGCNHHVPNNPATDSLIKSVFAQYESALIKHDTSFAEQYFVSEKEYADILAFVRASQPNCIGTDEESFSAAMNKKVFMELLNSSIQINQLYVNKIEYNSSCGNLLVIPRVLCMVMYNKSEVIEVPFLMIKTMNGEYKIVRNFLNLKFFPNE